MSREASMISIRPSKRDSLLFVYGTLRPFVAIPMANRLAAGGHHLGTGKTRGRLYDLGAYPGLTRPRARREWVVGDVYRIRNPRMLRVLDRYEAGARTVRPTFVRVPCVVTLMRLRRRAWVYLYRRSVLHAARIASGDYRQHLAR
jgi:gamma-glutamylcyclotransferase (GGCT)/AIG2-like uncharacterized protein YtfP